MAYGIFIKMDGITGELADAKHRGEIDVLSWSWGVTLSTSAGGAGGHCGRVASDAHEWASDSVYPFPASVFSDQ